MVAVGPEVSINEPLTHERGGSGHQNHIIIDIQEVRNGSRLGLSSSDACMKKKKSICVAGVNVGLHEYGGRRGWQYFDLQCETNSLK